MISDYFGIALKNVTHRKVRSWLTMMGIFVGIAAVVALVSLTQGLKGAVEEEFSKLGANRISVSPAGIIAGPPSAGLSSAKITEDDLRVIERVSGVENAFGILISIANVEYKGETKRTYVRGVPSDSDTMKSALETGIFEVKDGKTLKSGDVYKAMVGNAFNEDFFDKPVNIGDQIEIEGFKFKVVAVLESSGIGFDESIITIPLDTAREIFNEPEIFSTISITAFKTETPSDIAENIKRKMRISRGEKEGEESFSVETFEETLGALTSILTVIQVILVGIAAISLLVGGIGIMNTMYTAVLERTREIGIMKAIGARNSNIFIMFLIESGILGIIGGLLGVGLGVLIGKGVAFAASQALGSSLLKATFPWYLIVGALAFAFIVGCASGTTPALQAAKLKPVDALRYE